MNPVDGSDVGIADILLYKTFATPPVACGSQLVNEIHASLIIHPRCATEVFGLSSLREKKRGLM